MRFFNGFKKRPINVKQAQKESKEGAIKRAKIIAVGMAMKRLIDNPDFKLLVEELEDDKVQMNKNLLNEEINLADRETQRTRLIARINQIDRLIAKPTTLIWQMENLTEVRAAIKEQTQQTLVRQAHGNKTGGEDGKT